MTPVRTQMGRAVASKEFVIAGRDSLAAIAKGPKIGELWNSKATDLACTELKAIPIPRTLLQRLLLRPRRWCVVANFERNREDQK